MLKNIKDFTIGTDTEFLCVAKTGKLIHAGDFADKTDDLGADANGRTFEVRSKPSNSPIEVINSIKTIMQEAVIDNPTYYEWKWLASSFIKGLPLGCHLHYAINKNLINPKDACVFLDNYVGAVTILLEDREQGLARRAYNTSPGGNPVSYGKAGDFREKKNYGGFEYRTPSSCLGSPHAMKALLCLGKAVLFQVINDKSFSPTRFVMPEDYTNMNQEKVRRCFISLWSDVKKLSLYKEYHKHLDLIPFLVKNNLTWLPKKNIDVKKAWGILHPKFIGSDRISLNTIWNKVEFKPADIKENKEEYAGICTGIWKDIKPIKSSIKISGYKRKSESIKFYNTGFYENIDSNWNGES